MRRLLAAAIASLALLALLAGCEETVEEGPTATAPAATPTASDEATPTDATTTDVTPVVVGDGSAGGFLYLEPVPLVPGQYISPAGTAEAQERGMAAFNAEKGKPQFEGVVNGIRLWSFEHAVEDYRVMKTVCGGGDYVEWREVKTLVFGYLPPGTATYGPQQEAVCEDGSVGWTGQHFVAFNTTFDIWYESGERAFGQDGTVSRIEAATVQGRPGLVIRPLTEEGFGRTWVVFATSNGMIGVDARDMPLDEALKIAEDIRCESC